MSDRIMELAIWAASQSKFKFRVGAVVYEGNKVVSYGWNDPLKTHPKSPTPYNTKHAEFDAILGVDRKKLKRCSIYVHRLLADGRPGMAKPCPHCDLMLKEAGIKEISYSTDE